MTRTVRIAQGQVLQRPRAAQLRARVPSDGPGAAIGLRAGRDRLLARVTARAVREMELVPGMSCYAILKATTVAPGSIGR